MKKRILALFMSICILTSSLAFAVVDLPMERISGSNRYETAVNISKKTFESAGTVIIANGYNYVDALAASSLAAAIESPILLTDAGNLPAQTINEVQRLRATKAIILGGERTINSSVQNKLNDLGLETVRIGGQDRFETSELIFEELKRYSEIFEVMIATNEIDALASSPVRSTNIPLLLINKNSPSSFVSNLNLKKTVIGGELQIDNNLFNRIKADKRISGSNRYETAAIMAGMIDSKTAIIVNSENLVDAFTASSYATKNNYPILLSNNKKADDKTKEHIIKTGYQKLILIGGPSVLSNDIFKEYNNLREPKNINIKGSSGNYNIDYSYFGQFSNSGTEWWFRHPVSYYDGTKATIEDYRQNTVNKFGALWQAPQTGTKTVYLTFDEGYEYNNNTAKLLDIAKQKDVKFTFFLTDAYLNQSPEIVKRMAAEGHLVGNHSMRHERGSEIAARSVDATIEEYNQLETKYENLTGAKMSKFMRPPYGDYSDRYLAILQELGYVPVFWSFGYHDWDIYDQPSQSYALDSILKQLHDGSIILLHTISNTNIEIMPKLIDEIKAKGYKIETLDKLDI